MSISSLKLKALEEITNIADSNFMTIHEVVIDNKSYDSMMYNMQNILGYAPATNSDFKYDTEFHFNTPNGRILIKREKPYV